MRITIPAGTTLTAENGVGMLVGDESFADVVAVDHVLTVRFEDGEEYTVRLRDLRAGTVFASGQNVTSVNGVATPDDYTPSPGGRMS
jgi:hypothetical protein